MPKKLTKLMVKRKMATASKAIGNMLIDKATHDDSKVPFSVNALIDLRKKFRSASARAFK